MEQERDLLKKILCSMLPYDIQIEIEGCKGGVLKGIDGNTISTDSGINYPLRIVKPYLRPMSSMTEEEKEELRQEHIKDEKLFAECLTKAANGDSSMRGKVVLHFAADWCNKNHFDYRGLIPKGLAIEAPKGMYDTKTK